MRRRRSSPALLGGMLAALLSVESGAQEFTDAGALFLLLPVGAQSVGMGQAMVAVRPGSEAVWWNPAGIARATKREAAIHHSQTIAATGDAISLLLPVRFGGAVALSFNILNFGDQQITDPGGSPVGLVLPRNILVAATYGTGLGRFASAGVSVKQLQYRVDCSGQCGNVSTFTSSSSAIDFGAQYMIPAASLTLGGAVRNLGKRIQINDREQPEPLPTRVEIGAEYGIPNVAQVIADTEVRVAGDIIAERDLGSPSARLGAEITWQSTVRLRAGYTGNDTDGANAALGFGLATGPLSFDIARTFGGLSADAGQTPTYFSLRYLF